MSADAAASAGSAESESVVSAFLEAMEQAETPFPPKNVPALRNGIQEALETYDAGLVLVGLGWWMAEISAVFLASAIIVGLIARMSEEELTSTFINGARDLLGVALIIGIARGIVVIMDKGMITHTILHSAEGMVTGLSTVAFINVMYWLEVVLSFLVPSSSGLAVLTMPIMAPLADFANVNRDLVVTAYQSASGIVNLITPTSAVVMGGLAIARVPYVRYLKWVAPLLGILTVVIMVALSLGALL